MIGPRPPIDMSDDELKAGIRSQTPAIAYSVNDYLAELDRRAAERHARALRRLTPVLVVATIAYTTATFALVMVTAATP